MSERRSDDTAFEFDISEETLANVSEDVNTYAETIRLYCESFPAASADYKTLERHIQPGADKTKHYCPQSPKTYSILPPQQNAAPPSFPIEERSLASIDGGPAIIILEGFPAPQCFWEIGSLTKVRPELFINHIDLDENTAQPRHLFGRPALPSAQGEILQIRFGSLVKSSSTTPTTPICGMIEEQKAAAEHKTSIDKLFKEKAYGRSRQREVYVHDEQYRTHEYMVSLGVSSTDSNQWRLICLTDRAADSAASEHHTMRSTVRQLPLHIALKNPGAGTSELRATLDELHPLKDVYVQDSDEHQLLYDDPFFLIGSVLAASARSWNQVINYLVENVRKVQNMEKHDVASCTTATMQLHSNIELVTKVEGYMSEHLCILDEGGNHMWARSNKKKAVKLRKRLIKKWQRDHERLLIRCRRLGQKCERAVNLVESEARLIVAQRASLQASEVSAVTRLAFFLIPPSFVASAFGMNVSELADNPPIWMFVVIAVGVTIFAWSVVNARQICHTTPAMARKIRKDCRLLLSK